MGIGMFFAISFYYFVILALYNPNKGNSTPTVDTALL